MLRRWKLWRCLLSPRSKTYVAQVAWKSMSAMARPPVTGCRSEMEPPLLWAMELMMAVPVESHARPIQKKTRCERFSVSELRSPKTPIV